MPLPLSYDPEISLGFTWQLSCLLMIILAEEYLNHLTCFVSLLLLQFMLLACLQVVWLSSTHVCCPIGLHWGDVALFPDLWLMTLGTTVLSESIEMMDLSFNALSWTPYVARDTLAFIVVCAPYSIYSTVLHMLCTCIIEYITSIQNVFLSLPLWISYTLCHYGSKYSVWLPLKEKLSQCEIWPGPVKPSFAVTFTLTSLNSLICRPQLSSE